MINNQTVVAGDSRRRRNLQTFKDQPGRALQTSIQDDIRVPVLEVKVIAGQ